MMVRARTGPQTAAHCNFLRQTTMALISGLGHGGSFPADPLPSDLLRPLRAALAAPQRSPADSDKLMKELVDAFSDGAFNTCDLPWGTLQELDRPAVLSALVDLARHKGASRLVAFGHGAAALAPHLQPPFAHLDLRGVDANVDLTALPECIKELTVDPARPMEIQLPRDLPIHIAEHANAEALAGSSVTVVDAGGTRRSRPLAPPALRAHAAAAAVAAGAAGAAAAAGAAGAGGAAAGAKAQPDGKQPQPVRPAVVSITQQVPQMALAVPPGAAYCLVNHDDSEGTSFDAMSAGGCAAAVAASPRPGMALVVLPTRSKDGRVEYALDGSIIRACRERGVPIQILAKTHEQAVAASRLRDRWQGEFDADVRVQDTHDVFDAIRDPRFQRYASDQYLTEALELLPAVLRWTSSGEPDPAAFRTLQAAVLADNGIFSAPLRRKLTDVDPATAPGAILKKLGDEIVGEWLNQARVNVRQWREEQNKLLQRGVVVRAARVAEPGMSGIGNLLELGKFLNASAHRDKLPALALYKQCFDYQRAKGTALQPARWDQLVRAEGQLASMKPTIAAALKGLSSPSAAADEAIVRLSTHAMVELQDAIEAFERAHPDGVYKAGR
jgi:hypothetical protein